MATRTTKTTFTKEVAPAVDNKYDEHYKGDVEPIELMKAQMSPEAYMGFLRGNIIKYASRFGKKDETIKEATKILFYAEQLYKVVEHNG